MKNSLKNILKKRNKINIDKTITEIITNKYKNTLPRVKVVGFSYLIIATCLFSAYNYIDCYEALHKYRSNEMKKYGYNADREWRVITYNINYKGNFLNALFFPLMISVRFFPALVLATSPDPLSPALAPTPTPIPTPKSDKPVCSN